MPAQAAANDPSPQGNKINPYETDLERIPDDDPFKQRSPHYGRYRPRSGDFQAIYRDWHENDPEAMEYWEETVMELWKPENSLGLHGARQAYASGNVIIRVDEDEEVGAAADKFSCLNENELSASRKGEEAFRDIGVAVPRIYFCGTVSGKNVTVESRIPGVSLDVAWRYLVPQQIDNLKQQCRIVSQQLSNIDSGSSDPCYVCSSLNSHLMSAGQLERDLLFSQNDNQQSFPLVHNNMIMSNIVVDNHRIVGLIGWRDSGYFGFGRAERVHRQVRVPRLISESPEMHNVQTWANLYQGMQGTSPETEPAPRPVKVEPSSTNLDGVPLNAEADAKMGGAQLESEETPEGHPTPRKITNLKNQGASRASSSDRSSPANSTKAPAKRTAPASKKGVGRKPSTKKRKVDNQDNESVDSRRSQTPSSSRASKVPGGKKQSSASLANSPAPEPKKKRGRKPKAEQEDEGEDESEEDPDAVFCICRRPDNHTWMIGCDGGCEDWFHGKCVNIHPRDAELIEQYICKLSLMDLSRTNDLGPNCMENGKGCTKWKPMCRLEECRKPARFVSATPSKYCSDEHGFEFMRQKTQHLNISSRPNSQKPKSVLRTALNGTQTPRDDDSEYDSHAEDDREDSMEDLGSRGGVVTLGDLTAVIMGVGSAEEFRKLGAHIVSPPSEEADQKPDAAETQPETGAEPEPNNYPEPETNRETQPSVEKTQNKLGLDVGVEGLHYSPDEAQKLEKLRKQRGDLFHRRDMLNARNTFLTLLRQRSKAVLDALKKKDPKGGWKDICGFDARLAWSDEEFDDWRLSDKGKKALEQGTPEALALSYPDPNYSDNVDADGDTAMNGSVAEDDLEKLARGVCTKKRCERHKQWIKVQQQDSAFEERTLQNDLAECEKEAKGVVERAVLRMWAENGNLNARLENGDGAVKS